MIKFIQDSSRFLHTGKLLLEYTKSIKTYLTLLLFSILMFNGKTLAQTTFDCPDADRCTSKDLEVVGAFIEGVDECFTCTPGTTITKNLFLSIINKTGSVRPAFAFFGTIVGSTTPGPISRCGGPIAANSTVNIGVGTITFICGTELKLTDVFLAWSDASGTTANRCQEILADACKSIAPKCGTAAEIIIRTPLVVAAASSVKPCEGTNTGSITFAATGGNPPYSYTLSGNGITPVTNTTGVFTGLGAGTYTITVKDSKNCTATNTFTLGSNPNPAAPGVSVTQPTCTVATGCINVTSPLGAGFTYSINGTFQASPQFCGLAPGTYQVRVKNSDGCISNPTSKTINAAPATPTCSLTSPANNPICGSTGNQLCATGTTGVTYLWTLTGTGWVITAGQGTACITYTAGGTGTLGTFTLKVTKDGCFSTCTVTFGCSAPLPAKGCTPGFWKNTRTRWDQATDAVSLCIANAKGAPYNGTGTTSSLFRETFGLTSAQMTAAGLDPNLTLLQAINTGGGGCFKLLRHATAALLNSCALSGSYKYTTDQVLTMTHDAIVNKACEPTASKLAAANETGNCPLRSDGNDDHLIISQSLKSDAIESDDKELIKASPNPFTTNVQFIIRPVKSGKYSLDVFNSVGAKMANAFKGYLYKGEVKTVNFNASKLSAGSLVYRLTGGYNPINGILMRSK